MTVSFFKAHFNTGKIDIIKNPKTDKLFWTSEVGMSGPVSSKCDLKGQLEFSLLPDVDGANANVWCLVNPQQDNLVVTL